MTLQVQFGLLACWTMGERDMVVGDVVEEMYFLLFEE